MFYLSTSDYGSLTRGVGRMQELVENSDSMSESHITTQPFGLTNLQCKVIGPYFTQNGTHCHPDVTDISSIAPFCFEAPTADEIMTAAEAKQAEMKKMTTEATQPSGDQSGQVEHDDATGAKVSKSMAGLVELLGSGAEPVPFPGNNPPLVLHSLCDPELAKAVLLSIVEGISEGQGFEKLQVANDALEVIDSAPSAELLHHVAQNESTADAAIAVKHLQILCAVRIQVQPFGHQLERAVSAALVGRECLWNVLRDAILREMAKDAAQRVEGTREPPSLHQISPEMMPYIAFGHRVSEEVEQRKAFVLARLLHRPILLYQSKAQTLFAALPGGDASSVVPRPIVIVDGAAIVPCRRPVCASSDDSFVVKCILPASAKIVTLPKDQKLSDFVKVEKGEGEGEGGLVIHLNPPIDSHKFSIIGCDVFDATTSTPQLPSSCRQFVHEDGTLCFSSFPAGAFTLCDDPIVENELLASPGFGADQAAYEYLYDELSQIENVAPLHVDADGHCMLHSLSRCLIGKEYLWHALRHALHNYMATNLESIKELLSKNDMLAALGDEMEVLTKRAHSEFVGEAGMVDVIGKGLGVEHLFLLANVLRRPILLLDNLSFSHHQSFVLLPLLVPPHECKTKRLLVLGWNNQGHVHFVPIIPKCSNRPARISKKSLPMSADASDDKTARPLVYACPSDADADRLLCDYIYFSDDGWAEIGGEGFTDIRPWAQGVVNLFREDTGVNIWSIHEVARYVQQTTFLARYTSSMAVIKDVTKFTREFVQVLRETKLYYCGVCTKTVDKETCSTCNKKTAAIDPVTAKCVYEENWRTPIKSDKEFACCIFKHWVPYPPGTLPQPGCLLFARDQAGDFQVGKVLQYHKEDFSCDVSFCGSGRVASTRFYCPKEDYMLGFPCDRTPMMIHATFGGVNGPLKIMVDANPLICDPQAMATLFVDQNIKRLPKEKQANRETYIKDVMNDIQLRIKKLQRATDERHTTPKRDFSKQREPKFSDSEGNQILWESRDPMSWEWIPYEHAHNGLIEAAYQDGDVSQAVEISGYGTYTVRFSTFEQENPRGFARAVRRLALKKWECKNCTMENDGTNAFCFMCREGGVQTPRPSGAVTIMEGTYTTTTGSSWTFDLYDYDEEADEEKSNAEYEKMLKQVAEDKGMQGPDGEMYVSAMSVFERRPMSTFVHFRSQYGSKWHFYLGPEKQLVLLPRFVQPSHPFYQEIRTRGMHMRAGKYLYRNFTFQECQKSKSLRLLHH